MDFSKALREVYDCNSAFWRSRHDSVADLSAMPSQCHQQNSGLLAQLHCLLLESMHDVLGVINSCVLTAVVSFESILLALHTKRLTYEDSPSKPKPLLYGTYVPPKCIAEHAMRPVVPTWRARPIEDSSLDLFFEGPNTNDTEGRLAEILLRPSGEHAAVAQDNTADLVSASVRVESDSGAADLTSARSKSFQGANSRETLCSSNFFESWGLNDDDSPGESGPDLDTFLDNCLGSNPCVAE